MKTESVEIDRRKRGVVWAEGISPVNIFFDTRTSTIFIYLFHASSLEPEVLDLTLKRLSKRQILPKKKKTKNETFLLI